MSAEVDDGHATKYCECCGQKIRKLNPHRMDFSKIKILRSIAKINAAGHEWVKIQQDQALIKEHESQFTIQCDAVHALRLKWFGLLDHMEGRTGLFKINKNGVDFLTDKYSVPARIYCREGIVVEYDEHMVFLSDVKNVILDKGYWDNYQGIYRVMDPGEDLLDFFNNREF